MSTSLPRPAVTPDIDVTGRFLSDHWLGMTAFVVGIAAVFWAYQRAVQQRPLGAAWLARLETVNGSVIVAGVASTALLGLVAEDLLPTLTEGPQFVPWRWVGLALALLWLVVSLDLRRRIAKLNGTLFYLQLLPKNMTDRHTRTVEMARRSFQALRVILKSHATSVAPEQVEEWVADVQDLAEHGITALADDNARTANHLAPNLLWAPALGVGALLGARATVELIELRTHVGPEPSVEQLDAIDFRWHLDLSQAPKPDDDLQSMAHGDDPDGLLVTVLNLTGEATSRPTQWRVDRVWTAGPQGSEATTPTRIVAEADRGTADALPASRAIDQARWAVAQALHASDGRPVLLVGRAPKTISLALGMVLGVPEHSESPGTRGNPVCGDNDCDVPQCREPWKVIIPARVQQTPGGDLGKLVKFIPCRIHPRQPSVEEIADTLRAYELPGSSGDREEPQPTSSIVGSLDLCLTNLTPHAVVVLDGTREILHLDPSGSTARLPETLSDAPPFATALGDVPVRLISYGDDVEGLPPPAAGQGFVVSRVLAAAVSRDDLYFPGGEVRDERGNIVGCRYLGRFVTGVPDA